MESERSAVKFIIISQIEGTKIPVAKSKVLGILWDDENDEFIFNFTEI